MREPLRGQQVSGDLYSGCIRISSKQFGQKIAKIQIHPRKDIASRSPLTVKSPLVSKAYADGKSESFNYFFNTYHISQNK
jgi:hypothetical protein